MKTNNDSAVQTPKELLNRASSPRHRGRKNDGSFAHRKHAEDAMGALRTRFDAAQERLGVMYEGAKQRVVAGAKCTDQTIRANPYQSLAIAAGVGMLMGVLLGRRSK